MPLKNNWANGQQFTAADQNAVATQVNTNTTDVSGLVTALAGKQSTGEKNQPNGYAGLDGTGKVAAAQLPSYVDDVLEFANLAAFPGTGESGKIYIAVDSGKTYRWSGSTYAVISETLAIGTTSSTAKAGDYQPAWSDVTGKPAVIAAGADQAAARTAIGAVSTADSRLTDTRTPTDGSVTTAKIAGATLVTLSEGISANNNDTTIPTSAAVKAYADSVGGGGGGGGAVDSVVAGDNIDVDNSDPANPVISVEPLTKADVGLANVDNTADTAKPVSTAQQTALNLKANLASPTFTGTVSGISKAMVGLGSVDNTADTAKPVSTAQQAALDLKAPLASPAFTGTPTGITKAHVGLGNVDNTADSAKPISSATATALSGKEPTIAAGTTAQYWRGDKTWQTLPGAVNAATSGFEQVAGTRKIASSMAKALAGTGVSEHLVIGDSMSSAYTGAGFDFANSWHRKLKAKLVASGYPDGGTGLIATNEANGGKDPRWSFSGTVDSTSNVYVALGSASSTATFTSDTPGTAIDVIYSNAGGSFSVKVDGGSAVAVVASGALTIGTYTVTGLANTPHTITVTATSGSAIICAAQVRNTAGVRFSSLGKYGLQAAGFLGDGGYVKSVATAAMPSPDVVHIAIGANDMIGGASASTTVANVQTIRNLWPNADVILYAEPITTNAEITDAAYQVYATGLRTLATTLGCPLVDWNLRYGGATSVQAMGFVGPDNRHPNAIGQTDMSNVAFRGLTQASVTAGKGGVNVSVPVTYEIHSTYGTRAVGYGDNTMGLMAWDSFTLTGIVFRGETADASGSSTFEVRQNGTQITGSSKAITSANQWGYDSDIIVSGLNVAVNAGDVLRPYISAVGTTPGKGFSVVLVGTKTVALS